VCRTASKETSLRHLGKQRRRIKGTENPPLLSADPYSPCGTKYRERLWKSTITSWTESGKFVHFRQQSHLRSLLSHDQEHVACNVLPAAELARPSQVAIRACSTSWVREWRLKRYIVGVSETSRHSVTRRVFRPTTSPLQQINFPTRASISGS
jgi:hypothetical protein